MEGSYGSIGPGGLGMPTGGISELGGGLGNGSSLPGLSSLGPYSPRLLNEYRGP